MKSYFFAGCGGFFYPLSFLVELRIPLRVCCSSSVLLICDCIANRFPKAHGAGSYKGCFGATGVSSKFEGVCIWIVKGLSRNGGT